MSWNFCPHSSTANILKVNLRQIKYFKHKVASGGAFTRGHFFGAITRIANISKTNDLFQNMIA